MNELTGLGGTARRDFLKVSGLALVAGLVPSAFSVGSAFAAEQVLKCINPSFDMNWSPLIGGGNNYSLFSFNYASPMYFDSEMKLHPYVFTEWKPNADFTVWTFKILADAKFSDGSPITADEVKGSFEVAARPATKSQRIEQVISGVIGFADVSSGKAKEIPGLVAVDDQTLEVRLAAADPIFFMRVASNLTPVVKASAMRDENGDEVFEWWHPDNNPAVSGPFVPTVMNLDEGHIELEPNPNFFGPKPKLARIVIQTIEDPVQQTALLQRGDFQMTMDLQTPTAIDDLGAEFVGGPMIPRGHHFWLDVNKEPTNDPKVRQALILAVNRDDLIRASYPQGPHQKADQILTAVEGVDPDWVPYPFDPEKAKKLLAESSYGGPEKLPRIMMVGISNPATQAAAQFIAEQWRQNLGIDRVDTKPDMDNYSGPDQARIQVFRDDVATRVPDAVAFLRSAIHSSSGNAKSKMGGYKNEEVDRLLDEAAMLSVEDPKRIELAQKAQRVFREDYAFIPWNRTVTSRFVLPSVQGIHKNLDWQYVEAWGISM
jgi:peptide/nickel transport system substrate-binding protein